MMYIDVASPSTEHDDTNKRLTYEPSPNGKLVLEFVTIYSKFGIRKSHAEVL